MSSSNIEEKTTFGCNLDHLLYHQIKKGLKLGIGPGVFYHFMEGHYYTVQTFLALFHCLGPLFTLSRSLCGVSMRYPISLMSC